VVWGCTRAGSGPCTGSEEATGVLKEAEAEPHECEG
jgi:hypothetical protein